ncbi:hypothetical protein [Alkalihalophilus marmarensis]|uniref:Uncharacterized protein n=1 Tax=Alkalihalophilus marmarensis DSM 21297 TaxID=1188261 RepID=U6SL15_9BACI|nr:hypothetical protein [Alkalihalophilus marmarensis]ERN52082.1 hypothetical protein A33I_18490 [Alkalihalophilus marmarensis DSM 21297]
MNYYHKIVLDGEDYFQEFDESTERYEGDLLTKEELLERLLEDMVEEEVEVSEDRLRHILSGIPKLADRYFIENYIRYLERMKSDI